MGIPKVASLLQNSKYGMQHRILGLDILRSLAVLFVIFSHWANNMSYWYGFKMPNGVFFMGDLGVDLFFALSGFLIGQILLNIIAQGPSWRSLRVFLVRRWLRTLPVYFVWLLVLAIFFPPASGLAAYLLRFGTLTQNLFRPMPADYWYAVTWSLTIEEWFYLLFGTAAIAVTMLIRRSWAIALPLAAILTIPPILRLSMPEFLDFTTGYFKLVPLRLDEIGYGVALAWLYSKRSRIFKYPLMQLGFGIFLIMAAWLALLPIPFRIFVVFQHNLSVIGCTLCIPAALLIRQAPFWLDFSARHIARLSYTLYLVHLTILVDFAQSLWWTHQISTENAVIISVAGPVLVAELLSRLIEQPLMRMRPRQFALRAAESQGLIPS